MSCNVRKMSSIRLNYIDVTSTFQKSINITSRPKRESFKTSSSRSILMPGPTYIRHYKTSEMDIALTGDILLETHNYEYIRRGKPAELGPCRKLGQKQATGREGGMRSLVQHPARYVYGCSHALIGVTDIYIYINSVFSYEKLGVLL